MGDIDPTCPPSGSSSSSSNSNCNVNEHHRQPIRLAILECDEPIGHTKAKYGGYGNLFAALLAAGAAQLSRDAGGRAPPPLDITKYDVVNQEVYPDLEAVDGVLLTGSRYNSFDDDPWIRKLVAFTREVLAHPRVRLIGVCFGHQIVGRALDGHVGRNARGWEVAVVPVELTETGKQLLGMEKLAIHQMHRDIVYECPSGVERLGSSDRCEVQGMYARGRLLTVQGHPEFNEAVVTELLERRHEQGIFDDGMFKDGLSRVQEHHDGVAVGVAFLRFLLEE